MSVLLLARYRTLRNVYGVGSPTVGPTSSVRLLIYNVCAVRFMAVISLSVTFNNQFNSPNINLQNIYHICIRLLNHRQ